ncbi:MAG: hypothetical protein C0417_06075 [Chlorobiaceae bacterium]|nr:hypothetical protein [Chlorobiaceae bacterium]
MGLPVNIPVRREFCASEENRLFRNLIGAQRSFLFFSTSWFAQITKRAGEKQNTKSEFYLVNFEYRTNEFKVNLRYLLLTCDSLTLKDKTCK